MDVSNYIASPDGTLTCIEAYSTQGYSFENIGKDALFKIDLLQSKVECFKKLESIDSVDATTVKNSLSMGMYIKHP